MENREKLEQLLEHYSYEELADEERAWVNTFSSQEEYEALRLLNKHLDFSYKQKTKPRPETWKKIKTYQRANNRELRVFEWFKYPVPLYVQAAMLVAVGTLFFWIGSSYNSNTIFLDRTLTKVDTVFVPTKADTVFKQKIVYIKVVVPSNPSFEIEPDHKAVVSKGVNMKDKEELEKLLVSGSD
jgi:hypothetical protein